MSRLEAKEIPQSIFAYRKARKKLNNVEYTKVFNDLDDIIEFTKTTTHQGWDKSIDTIIEVLQSMKIE